MSPHEAAALAANDAVFSEPVTYIGGGLAGLKTVHVIWSDTTGQRFQGAGETTRTISCEVPYASLPHRPSREDRLVRSRAIWKPIQVTDRDDIKKWVLVLERVGEAP